MKSTALLINKAKCNLSQSIGLYIVGGYCYGYINGFKFSNSGDTKPFATDVSAAVVIQKLFFDNMDFTEMKFNPVSNGNYVPYGINTSQVNKVIFGKVLHSLTSPSPLAYKDLHQYTTTFIEDYIGVTDTSAARTISLGRGRDRQYF